VADAAVKSTFTTAAKPAQPLGRGLPGPGLLAPVIVSKYGDHLPLYRLEHILGRCGVSLSRQTLCGWLAASAALVRPLYELLAAEVLQSGVLGTDDTPVPVQQDGRGQTRQGRVWDYLGDVFHPYVVYACTPNREQAGPQRFLGSYLGYLQADAYAGYDALYATGRIVEVACWAHARRQFYEAQGTDPERSLYVLGVIRQLYRVERQADAEIDKGQLCRDGGWWLRLRLRQEQARPLLTSLCQWLHEQRGRVLPKRAIGAAIGYACNLWPALERCTSQGYLAIDNNAAERALRALRAIAVGRKHCLFFGSDLGGETAAVCCSLVQSCKRLGIEPWRYLRELLEQVPSWPAERLAEWLPDRWAARQRARATGGPGVGGASPAGP
jgi:transposase